MIELVNGFAGDKLVSVKALISSYATLKVSKKQFYKIMQEHPDEYIKNQSAINAAEKLRSKNVCERNLEVLYITGKNYYDDFIKDGDFFFFFKIVPYYDNLASIMKDAYLIISRAGASTISEILALKIPSILIPSPYVANNHQYYNALDLANMKVSELIEEKDLNSNIIKVMVNELVYNDELYNEFKNNLEKLNIKESSSIIYDEIKEILK